MKILLLIMMVLEMLRMLTWLTALLMMTIMGTKVDRLIVDKVTNDNENNVDGGDI